MVNSERKPWKEKRERKKRKGKREKTRRQKTISIVIGNDVDCQIIYNYRKLSISLSFKVIMHHNLIKVLNDTLSSHVSGIKS